MGNRDFSRFRLFGLALFCLFLAFDSHAVSLRDFCLEVAQLDEKGQEKVKSEAVKGIAASLRARKSGLAYHVSEHSIEAQRKSYFFDFGKDTTKRFKLGFIYGTVESDELLALRIRKCKKFDAKITEDRIKELSSELDKAFSQKDLGKGSGLRRHLLMNRKKRLEEKQALCVPHKKGPHQLLHLRLNVYDTVKLPSIPLDLLEKFQEEGVKLEELLHGPSIGSILGCPESEKIDWNQLRGRVELECKDETKTETFARTLELELTLNMIRDKDLHKSPKEARELHREVLDLARSYPEEKERVIGAYLALDPKHDKPDSFGSSSDAYLNAMVQLHGIYCRREPYSAEVDSSCNNLVNKLLHHLDNDSSAEFRAKTFEVLLALEFKSNLGLTPKLMDVLKREITGDKKQKSEKVAQWGRVFSGYHLFLLSHKFDIDSMVKEAMKAPKSAANSRALKNYNEVLKRFFELSSPDPLLEKDLKIKALKDLSRGIDEL